MVLNLLSKESGMLNEGVLSSSAAIEDSNLDLTLRPKRFNDFIGQDRIKENLHIYIKAAKKGVNQLITSCFPARLVWGKRRYPKSLRVKQIPL